MTKFFIMSLLLYLNSISVMASEKPSQSSASKYLQEKDVQETISSVTDRLMRRYSIPGMAVSLVLNGRVIDYYAGVQSKESRVPVNEQTLFEIGSVSKVFTAILTSMAEGRQLISYDDSIEKYLPDLKGTPFGQAKVLQMPTHTIPDLPLQVPDTIQSEKQLMDFLKEWKPSHDYAGTDMRRYSNIGIGLAGAVSAKVLKNNFTALINKEVLKPLKMKDTFYKVPDSRDKDYAEGYSKKDKPRRLSAGYLGDEAYGLKTSAQDLIKLVDANIRKVDIPGELSEAINRTKIAYFDVGPFQQTLVWEKYSYPFDQEALNLGSAGKTVYRTIKAQRLHQLEKADKAMYHKTGSTGGFGAYAAFIPSQKIGIVILANKNYPNQARVKAAVDVMSAVLNDTRK